MILEALWTKAKFSLPFGSISHPCHSDGNFVAPNRTTSAKASTPCVFSAPSAYLSRTVGPDGLEAQTHDQSPLCMSLLRHPPLGGDFSDRANLEGHSFLMAQSIGPHPIDSWNERTDRRRTLDRTDECLEVQERFVP